MINTAQSRSTPTLLKEMHNRMSEDTDSHLSNSFLLDDDSSVQFSIEENMDVQTIKIHLTGQLGLPPVFLENPSFSFLLSSPNEQWRHYTLLG